MLIFIKIKKRDMRVKFTNPLTKEIMFGTVTSMFDAEMLVVQADKGGRYVLNPNSDYNFEFELNEEGERRRKAGFDALIEKIEKADRERSN
jgi:hypothetical protein